MSCWIEGRKHLPRLKNCEGVAGATVSRDRLVLKPISIPLAKKYVDHHHRKLGAPQGAKFAVSAVKLEAGAEGSGYPWEDLVVGVALVGRPSAQKLDDGWTAEVTRLAVLEGYPNACSFLYGACWRASKAMGYRRLITYTNARTETGVSLKASGWVLDDPDAGGGNWADRELRNPQRTAKEPKARWVKTIKGL